MAFRSPISLVCLDLAGTAVVDDNNTVERAFIDALAVQGIVPGTSAFARSMVVIYRMRGMPTIEIFRSVFGGDEPRAAVAELAFERSYDSLIGRAGLTPLPGAENALDKLAGEGIKVAFITGYSRVTLGRVLDMLGWWNRAELALCPDDVPRGKPWPDMVLTAVLKYGIEDVRQVTVIGDTESDILCGVRAGASIVAGVLTGAHSEDRLTRAGATHILASIADLPEVVLEPAPAVAR